MTTPIRPGPTKATERTKEAISLGATAKDLTPLWNEPPEEVKAVWREKQNFQDQFNSISAYKQKMFDTWAMEDRQALLPPSQEVVELRMAKAKEVDDALEAIRPLIVDDVGVFDSVVNSVAQAHRDAKASKEAPGFWEGWMMQIAAIADTPRRLLLGQYEHRMDPVEMVGEAAKTIYEGASTGRLISSIGKAIGQTISSPGVLERAQLGGAAGLNLVSASPHAKVIYNVIPEIIAGFAEVSGVPVTRIEQASFGPFKDFPISIGEVWVGKTVMDALGIEDDDSWTYSLAACCVDLGLAMLTGKSFGTAYTPKGAKANAAMAAENALVTSYKRLKDLKSPLADEIGQGVESFLGGKGSRAELNKKIIDAFDSAYVGTKEKDMVKRYLLHPIHVGVEAQDIVDAGKLFGRILDGEKAWGIKWDAITSPLKLIGWPAERLFGVTKINDFIAKHQGMNLVPFLNSNWANKLNAVAQRLRLTGVDKQVSSVRSADVFRDPLAGDAFSKTLSDPDSALAKLFKRTIDGLDKDDLVGLLGKNDVHNEFFSLRSMSASEQWNMIRESMQGRVGAEQQFLALIDPMRSQVASIFGDYEAAKLRLRSLQQRGRHAVTDAELAAARLDVSLQLKRLNEATYVPGLEDFFKEWPMFRRDAGRPPMLGTVEALPADEAKGLEVVGKKKVSRRVRVPSEESEEYHRFWSPAKAQEWLTKQIVRGMGNEQAMLSWAEDVLKMGAAITDPIAVVMRDARKGLLQALAGGFSRNAGLGEMWPALRSAMEEQGALASSETLDLLRAFMDQYGRLPNNVQKILETVSQLDAPWLAIGRGSVVNRIAQSHTSRGVTLAIPANMPGYRILEVDLRKFSVAGASLPDVSAAQASISRNIHGVHDMPIARIGPNGELEFVQGAAIFDAMATRPGATTVPVAVPESTLGGQVRKYGKLVSDISEDLGPASPTPDRLAKIGNLAKRALSIMRDNESIVSLTEEQVSALRRMAVHASAGEVSDAWLKKYLSKRIDDRLKEKWLEGYFEFQPGAEAYAGGLSWTRPSRSKGLKYDVAFVRVKDFDAAVKAYTPADYVGRGGVGGDISAYTGFQKWGGSHGWKRPLNMPEVLFGSEQQGPSFISGKHRWAVSRDQGASVIPVAVQPGTRSLPGEVKRVKGGSRPAATFADPKMEAEYQKAKNAFMAKPGSVHSDVPPTDYVPRGTFIPGADRRSWRDGGIYQVTHSGFLGEMQAAAQEELRLLLGQMRQSLGIVGDVRKQLVASGGDVAKKFIDKYDDLRNMVMLKERQLSLATHPGEHIAELINLEGIKYLQIKYRNDARWASLFDSEGRLGLTETEIRKRFREGRIPYAMLEELENDPRFLDVIRGTALEPMFTSDPAMRLAGRVYAATKYEHHAKLVDETLARFATEIPFSGLSRSDFATSIATAMAATRDPVIVMPGRAGRLSILDSMDAAMSVHHMDPTRRVYVMDRRIASAMDDFRQTSWDRWAEWARTGFNAPGVKQVFTSVNDMFKQWGLLSFGYHARNFLQGMLVNFMVGTSPSTIAEMIRGGLNKDYRIFTPSGAMTLDEIADLFRKQGATRSMIGAGVPSSAYADDMTKLSDVLQPGKWKRIYGFMPGANRALAEKLEFSIRFPAFVHLLQEGNSPQYAANLVRHFFFDHQNLTKFEKNVMGAFVPWYSWFSNTVGFTFKEMWRNPGTAARYMVGAGLLGNVQREAVMQIVKPWRADDESYSYVTSNWRTKNMPHALIPYFMRGQLQRRAIKVLGMSDDDSGNMFYFDTGGQEHLHDTMSFARGLFDTLTPWGEGKTHGLTQLMAHLGPNIQLPAIFFGVQPRFLGQSITDPADPSRSGAQTSRFMNIEFPRAPTLGATPGGLPLEYWQSVDRAWKAGNPVGAIGYTVRDPFQWLVSKAGTLGFPNLVLNDPVMRILPTTRPINELTDDSRPLAAKIVRQFGITVSYFNVYDEIRKVRQFYVDRINELVGMLPSQEARAERLGKFQYLSHATEEQIRKTNSVIVLERLKKELEDFNSKVEEWENGFVNRKTSAVPSGSKATAPPGKKSSVPSGSRTSAPSGSKTTTPKIR